MGDSMRVSEPPKWKSTDGTYATADSLPRGPKRPAVPGTFLWTERVQPEFPAEHRPVVKTRISCVAPGASFVASEARACSRRVQRDVRIPLHSVHRNSGCSPGRCTLRDHRCFLTVMLRRTCRRRRGDSGVDGGNAYAGTRVESMIPQEVKTARYRSASRCIFIRWARLISCARCAYLLPRGRADSLRQAGQTSMERRISRPAGTFTSSRSGHRDLAAATRTQFRTVPKCWTPLRRRRQGVWFR